MNDLGRFAVDAQQDLLPDGAVDLAVQDSVVFGDRRAWKVDGLRRAVADRLAAVGVEIAHLGGFEALIAPDDWASESQIVLVVGLEIEVVFFLGRLGVSLEDHEAPIKGQPLGQTSNEGGEAAVLSFD